MHIAISELGLNKYPRSVRDLTLAARVVFGQPDELGVVAPMPFREVELPERLKFGFYTDGAGWFMGKCPQGLTHTVDGFVKSSPACERAVLETIAALRQVGHECVELNWPFGIDNHFRSLVFSLISSL
jgi:Asp-tRNA(Asn)/Glu-tRNA(Gln) amidotransferase A subunit family amidase